MLRLTLAALLIVWASLLAACAQEGPRRPIQLLGEAALSGPEAETVIVTLYEIPPGTSVETITLVGPQGERVPSGPFKRGHRESGPSYLLPNGVSIAITSGRGVSPNPVHDPIVSGGSQSVASDFIIAEIGLADPDAYLSDPRLWSVEIAYRDIVGSPQIRRLPAPRPR